MPELPEVETVARGLSPVLEGARIVRVEARRPDLRFPLPPRFAARLTGAGVSRVGRRGKYLTIELDTGETWIAHLGMSGRFTIHPPQDGEAHAPGVFHHDAGGAPTHDHVVIETAAGAVIVYNDPRRFGFMDLTPTAEVASCRHFAGMGPEPLSAGFTAAVLETALANRRAPIKAMLLDQRIVAGLGNIYVCEALFRARIAPERPAGDLSSAELARLVRAVRAVLGDAIAAGGSSLRDYAHTDGSPGYFQHAFDVYDREGAPCRRPRCRGLIVRTVQSNRSSFACPACQL